MNVKKQETGKNESRRQILKNRADLISSEMHVLVELTDKCMQKTEYNVPPVT
ncbi:hypothetical protein M2444_001377 [Paenibacillus sp. PastF-3]|jgi:hypothetical protein|uniref:hypothetical protein n=1 Tax=Paenibacillus TaxID=44249 RepID=UPI00247699CC|nr:hypothetical protein [Paenibacillus sp. PastF-3]MDH6369599.1 hypothetical protein [Paenibacillus sp. PastF-3]